MSNFQHAIDATNTALNSAGSAAKENASYMESLEAKENALAAEFEDFANRVLSNDVVKGFLEAGTSMLDFANNDVGAAITRIGLLATGMTGLTGIAGQTVGKIAEVGLQLKNLGVGGDSFLGILASGKVALIIGGVVLAISALVEIIKAVKNAYDEAHPSFEEANKNLQETQTEIQNTTTELEEYKKKLQEFDAIDPKDGGSSWAAERAELEVNVQTAEAYLEVLKQIEQAQTGKIEGSKYITGYTGQNVGDYSNGYIGTEASGQLAVTESQVAAITAQYKTQEEAVMSISLALKDYITGWETFNNMSQDEIVEELNTQLSALGINVHSTVETVGQSFENMGALADKAAEGFSNLTKAEQEQATQYLSDYQTLVHSLITMEGQLNTEQQNQIQTYYNLSAAASDFNYSQATTADTISFVASTFGITADAAATLASTLGYIDPSLVSVANNMVQLADGAWALKENCYQASDGIWYLQDGASQLATAVDSVGVTAANAATQLLTETNAVDTTSQSFRDLVAQEIIFNNTSYDVSAKIAALQALAIQAGVTKEAIAGISTAGVGGTSTSKSELLKEARAQGLKGKEATEWVEQQLQQESQTSLSLYYQQLAKMMEEAQNNKTTTGGGGGSSTKSAEEKAAEEAEKAAKKAQQAQEKAASESQKAYESAASSAAQAAQAAEQAAEEAKQKILDSIQELKDASDDFWDERTDTIEESNKELDRQKQLEEKLKALEEARQKKILLYKNGQFQYDKDYGTIAKAQADYEETRDKIQREKELEQLKEMKENATEIFNEMKDIISNGGDVTQDMINKWLSKMQADGADYYDSNKQILGEWLEWARNNLTEFMQGISDSIGEYVSTSSLMSGGSYGSSATATDTSGARYLADRDSKNPLYWDKNGDFVGFTKAFWIDVFDAQVKKGQFGDYTKTDAWLGNMPGTSLFDNWKEVFEYWANQPDADIYALQDMVDRFDAAKQVFNYYEDIFKSLGYDEYAKMAEQYKDVDTGDYWTMARKMMVAANPTDPSGERKHIEAWRGTRTEDSAELYQVAMDLLYDFMGLNKTDADTWKNQFTDTALGEFFDTAKREYHINREDESDRYKYATFDTEALKKALEENEEALKALSEKWFEAATDLDRQVIAAEAESRRKFRDLGYAELGIDTTAQSEAERAANRTPTGKTLDEARRDKKLANNVDDINKTLEKVENGQAISQGYITKASDYISKMIEENSEKWFTLYDQTEKDALHQQTEELRALQEKLQKANDLAEINNLLVHGSALLPNETADFEDEDWKDRKKYDDWVREAEDLDDTAEDIRRQMELNAKRWFDADEKTRDELHRANEELAERLEKETGTKLSYEGSTGKWSKNATGTHNFRGGLSLVGERGPEMRILGQGDNIIPANQTANLWKWSNTTPQAMLTTLSGRNGGGNTSYAFDVSRIELPNVTDAKSFVQGLKNYALQYSYKR